MASIRTRARSDGTTAHAVLYKLSGSQTAATFNDRASAEAFRDAVNTIGAERAMKAWDIGVTTRIVTPKGPTLGEWIQTYIDSRTGVTKTVLYDYRSYLRLDIAPTIGQIPLTVLSRDDISGWVQGLADRKLAGKTVANRHGFLSAALNAAVKAELIPSNPALGIRLPRTERAEMCFLTTEEFQILKQAHLEKWHPLLDFMVMSGMRFGEFSALKPSDVNRARGSVHVGRGWKRTYDSQRYELGAPKTKRSVRTISVPKPVLEVLDYTGEFLFLNGKGNPLRGSEFRNTVWYPALKRAKELGLEKKPRMHDMRHTCASWMIADGVALPTIQRHLGHESISTTVNLYGHLDSKDAEAAADLIGKRLG